MIEEVAFRPSITLEGFRVSSSFDIEKFNCQKLESEVFQLAVVLYPTDRFNERFLIKVRDCMLKLSDSHPIKRWLKFQSIKAASKPQDQKQIDFLNEILNSPFNLITDQKVKKDVIDLIAVTPENTKSERLLKSYLYLMIGNITRSDNLLKSLINLSPREFYKEDGHKSSFFHRLTVENLDKVLKKFSRHPADRLTFYLLTEYLRIYSNNPDLVAMTEDLDDNWKEKIRLTYAERSAPNIVGMIRLTRMGEKRRVKILRSDKYSLEVQGLWFWPYLEIDPLISEAMASQIKNFDSSDPLWATYLLANERLADLYYKKGGVPLNRRRGFLRKNLENKSDYMMSLYKLIELGDIDQGIVNSVVDFLTHD